MVKLGNVNKPNEMTVNKKKRVKQSKLTTTPLPSVCLRSIGTCLIENGMGNSRGGTIQLRKRGRWKQTKINATQPAEHLFVSKSN